MTLAFCPLEEISTNTWSLQPERFDTVTYVVDLCSYDEQSSRGNPDKTAMADNVETYKWLVQSLPATNVLLLFNNRDRFKRQLRISPLSDFYPELTGGVDLKSAEGYIRGLFDPDSLSHGARIDALFGNATDHNFLKHVLHLATTTPHVLDNQAVTI